MKHGRAQVVGITAQRECVTVLVVRHRRSTGHIPKKEALQPLSVPKNVVWNALAFRGKVIDEPMNGGGDLLVNQCIRLS